MKNNSFHGIAILNYLMRNIYRQWIIIIIIILIIIIIIVSEDKIFQQFLQTQQKNYKNNLIFQQLVNMNRLELIMMMKMNKN